MYSQERINSAFALFCQEPSTENRNALVAECKDLIDVVLSTTAGTSEDQDIRNEVEQDVNMKLLEFLSNPLLRDRVRKPSTFLFGFVKRTVLNCLEARWSSKPCPRCKGVGLVETATCPVCLGKGRVSLKPEQLPTTEKGWNRPGVKKPFSLSEGEQEEISEFREFLRGKRNPATDFYHEQGGRYISARGKQTKETRFLLRLLEEAEREFAKDVSKPRSRADGLLHSREDWKLERKILLESYARLRRVPGLPGLHGAMIRTATRERPYRRKPRSSKKTR